MYVPIAANLYPCGLSKLQGLGRFSANLVVNPHDTDKRHRSGQGDILDNKIVTINRVREWLIERCHRYYSGSRYRETVDFGTERGCVS